MSEWWTYRPEDFLLFSERVYWRLFELHNAAVWPLQVLALALGGVALLLVIRPRPWSGRFIALFLAAAWVFVAWSFLWVRYRPINWAVSYVVPLFVAEALLFAWYGVLRDQLVLAARRSVASVVGLGLFAYSLAFHPFLAVIAGRSLGGADVFGLTPDATAMGTLGLLALARGSAVWLLLVPPLAWCAMSTATLYAMGTWEAWAPMGAILLTLLARLWPTRSG